jgi:hypothetical protein
MIGKLILLENKQHNHNLLRMKLKVCWCCVCLCLYVFVFCILRVCACFHYSLFFHKKLIDIRFEELKTAYPELASEMTELRQSSGGKEPPFEQLTETQLKCNVCFFVSFCLFVCLAFCIHFCSFCCLFVLLFICL